MFPKLGQTWPTPPKSKRVRVEVCRNGDETARARLNSGQLCSDWGQHGCMGVLTRSLIKFEVSQCRLKPGPPKSLRCLLCRASVAVDRRSPET